MLPGVGKLLPYSRAWETFLIYCDIKRPVGEKSCPLITFFHHDDYINLANTGKLFAGLETRVYVNVSNAELYGLDGSLEFDLKESLTLFGNLAYVEGRDRDMTAMVTSTP